MHKARFPSKLNTGHKSMVLVQKPFSLPPIIPQDTSPPPPLKPPAVTLGDVINPTQIIENHRYHPTYCLRKFWKLWIHWINEKIVFAQFQKKKLLKWIAYIKIFLTSNWQCQFDVWPWIAEGYPAVSHILHFLVKHKMTSQRCYFVCILAAKI